MWPKRKEKKVLTPPAWAEGGGAPRILIETPDAAEGWAVQRLMRRQGWEAEVCPGPDGEACPLLVGGSCPAAANAHVILTLVPLARPGAQWLVRALRGSYPQVPGIVEATESEAKKYGDALSGSDVELMPLAGDRLVAAVERALEGRGVTASRP